MSVGASHGTVTRGLVDMELNTRVWGEGEPVVCLHPIGLESSAFESIAGCLAPLGYQTIAADLPGFGMSLAGNEPLTAARLARPVVTLIEQLGRPVRLLGISLGGRVAIEVALTQPERVTSLVAVAPYLPWLRNRWFLRGGRLLSPRLLAAIPLEVAWPLLKRLTDHGLKSERMREDAVARAGTRIIYNMSCKATRFAIASAAREMTREPALGPDGLWERLRSMRVPSTFVWGARDHLVPAAYAGPVARSLPTARQIVVPCLRHSINAVHARCLESALTELYAEGRDTEVASPSAPQTARCRPAKRSSEVGPW